MARSKTSKTSKPAKTPEQNDEELNDALSEAHDVLRYLAYVEQELRNASSCETVGDVVACLREARASAKHLIEQIDDAIRSCGESPLG